MIISEVFLFVAEDNGPTDEGIAAFYSHEFECFMPMVAGDVDRLNSMMPVAEDIVRSTGKRIRVFKFSCREEVAVINP